MISKTIYQYQKNITITKKIIVWILTKNLTIYFEDRKLRITKHTIIKITIIKMKSFTKHPRYVNLFTFVVFVMPRVTINSSSTVFFWINRAIRVRSLWTPSFSRWRDRKQASTLFCSSRPLRVIFYGDSLPRARTFMSRMNGQSLQQQKQQQQQLPPPLWDNRPARLCHSEPDPGASGSNRKKDQEARVDIVYCGTSQSCLPYRTSEYTINLFRKPPVDVSGKNKMGKKGFAIGHPFEPVASNM